MSQKKVDQYKERKNGHSKEQKKEKFYDCVALVAWIGYSVYDKIEQKQDSVVTQTTMDTSALDSYVAGLSAETTE